VSAKQLAEIADILQPGLPGYIIDRKVAVAQQVLGQGNTESLQIGLGT
jgi:hypothetical protein